MSVEIVAGEALMSTPANPIDTKYGTIVFDAVEKSPHDHMTYKHFTLPNGLSVMLCRSTIEEKAKKLMGVALSVNVGHFADPDDFPGLAHFLEHMLFMGNEKYPGENDWESFMSKNGGFSNAQTGALNTIYEFEIQQEKLLIALDMFAQFFISPIFAPSAVLREIRAVDSEFKECYSDDGERMNDVMFCTFDKKHPAARFGWGNLKSLLDEPREKNLDLRAALLEFHAKYYSANSMKLVIVVDSHPTTPTDIQILETVMTSFTPIPYKTTSHTMIKLPLLDTITFNTTKSNLTDVIPSLKYESPEPFIHRDYSSLAPPFASCEGELFHHLPMRDGNTVVVSWAIPSQNNYYRTKPSEFIDHILGYESPGSLSLVLKQLGLAISVTTGNGATEHHFRNGSFWLLSVHVTLTTIGLEQYERVIEIIFQAIERLRRMTDEELYTHWSEYSRLRHVLFVYASSQEPMEVAESTSLYMQEFKPAHALHGLFTGNLYDPQSIRDVISYLTPRKMRVDISSNLFVTQFQQLHTFENPIEPREYEQAQQQQHVSKYLKSADDKIPIHTIEQVDRVNIGIDDNSNDNTKPITTSDIVFQTRYFKAKFTRTKILDSYLELLENADPHNYFPLPAENKYIPTDFTLLPSPYDRKAVEQATMSTILPVPIPKYIENNTKAQSQGFNSVPQSVIDEIPSLLRGFPQVSALPYGDSKCPIFKSSSGPYPVETLDDESLSTYQQSPYNGIHPSLLLHPHHVNSSHGELWLLTDTRLKLPRSSFTVLLYTASASRSTLDLFLASFFTEMLSDYLEESTYPAVLVDTSVGIEAVPSGIEFKFTGFSQTLPLLVTAVFNAISLLEQELTNAFVINTTSNSTSTTTPTIKSSIDVDSLEMEEKNTESKTQGQSPAEVQDQDQVQVQVSDSEGIINRFHAMREQTVRAYKHMNFEADETATSYRLLTMLQGRYHADELLATALGCTETTEMATKLQLQYAPDFSVLPQTPNHPLSKQYLTSVETSTQLSDDTLSETESLIEAAAGMKIDAQLDCEATHITPGVFVAYIREIFQTESYITTFAHGNMTPASAISMFDATVDALIKKCQDTTDGTDDIDDVDNNKKSHTKSHTTSQYYRKTVRKLHQKDNIQLLSAVRNPLAKASTISVLFQGGMFSPKLTSHFSLLDSMMYDPCFDALRTKKQLGYSVGTYTLSMLTLDSILIEVTSSSHSASDVLGYIERFLLEYRTKVLTGMKYESLDKYKSVHAVNLAQPATFNEVTSNIWYDIRDNLFVFDRKYRLIRELSKISKESLLAVYDALFIGTRSRSQNQKYIKPLLSPYEKGAIQERYEKSGKDSTSVTKAHSLVDGRSKLITMSLAKSSSLRESIKLDHEYAAVYETIDATAKLGDDDEDEDGEEDEDEDGEDEEEDEEDDGFEDEDDDEDDDEDEDEEDNEDNEDNEDDEDNKVDTNQKEVIKNSKNKNKKKDDFVVVDRDMQLRKSDILPKWILPNDQVKEYYKSNQNNTIIDCHQEEQYKQLQSSLIPL